MSLRQPPPDRGDTQATRAVLRRWARSPTTPQRVALRSRIVLHWLEGVTIREIASKLSLTTITVKLWIKRFTDGGIEALLHDAPGRGRRPSASYQDIYERLRSARLLGSDDWPVSLRRAAAFLGVSPTAVWRAFKKDAPRSEGRHILKRSS